MKEKFMQAMESVMENGKLYVQIKYSIVHSVPVVLRHKYPYVTILSYILYIFETLRRLLSSKWTNIRLLLIRDGKKEVIDGGVADFPVFLEGSEPEDMPVKTEIEFVKGKRAKELVKSLAIERIISIDDLRKILRDKHFYIRKEKIYYKVPPEHNLIVAISNPLIAKESMDKVKKFFKAD